MIRQVFFRFPPEFLHHSRRLCHHAAPGFPHSTFHRIRKYRKSSQACCVFNCSILLDYLAYHCSSGLNSRYRTLSIRKLYFRPALIWIFQYFSRVPSLYSVIFLPLSHGDITLRFYTRGASSTIEEKRFRALVMMGIAYFYCIAGKMIYEIVSYTHAFALRRLMKIWLRLCEIYRSYNIPGIFPVV